MAISDPTPPSSLGQPPKGPNNRTDRVVVGILAFGFAAILMAFGLVGLWLWHTGGSGHFAPPSPAWPIVSCVLSLFVIGAGRIAMSQ